jgi:hypothetical protein
MIIDSFSLSVEKSDEFFGNKLNKLMTEINNKNKT